MKIAYPYQSYEREVFKTKIKGAGIKNYQEYPLIWGGGCKCLV
jgi:hypothetical protein